jgi:hypothetical protein
MVSSQNPPPDDDTGISERLIGLLYRAADNGMLDLVAAFTADERATLAMFCYRKTHLRRIGLAIAATCDLNTLIQHWGEVLGTAIFTQSQAPSADRGQRGMRHRPAITLARTAGSYQPPQIDLDDIFEPERSAA